MSNLFYVQDERYVVITWPLLGIHASTELVLPLHVDVKERRCSVLTVCLLVPDISN